MQEKGTEREEGGKMKIKKFEVVSVDAPVGMVWLSCGHPMNRFCYTNCNILARRKVRYVREIGMKVKCDTCEQQAEAR